MSLRNRTTVNDSRGMVNLVVQHLNWYPLMQVQDVYKLLYQGVMGLEHLVRSAEDFSHRLAEEYDSIQADDSQQIFEPVRADEALFRLNLRPLKLRKIETNRLISPLIQTAETYRGTKTGLRSTWEEFVLICLQEGGFNFNSEHLEEFSHHVMELGYPPVHHSEQYSLAYQPAYRLVAKRYIFELGLADGN